jgi:pimeloyl-ACP methyl ester carboxylesterase
MGEKFAVYYLHGLGSSCDGTKALMTRSLVEELGGEFNCKNFDYLRKGNYPWEVLEEITPWVKDDKPFFLIGSSMGAYTWLDYMVNEPEVFLSPNFKGAILITPPTTLFDNLEKWAPLFGREKIFFNYGEDYIYDYPTFVRLMNWDLKFANLRLLTLAKPSMVSILAKRDTVVDNTPVYELKKVAKEMELYEIDDEHPLRNKLNELERLLRNILIQRTG